MVEQVPDAIKVLEEILGSLRITEDNKSNQSIEPAILETKEILTASVPVIHNKNIPIKNMVLDPG